MRSLVALLTKERLHHGGAALGMMVVLALGFFMSYGYAIVGESSTSTLETIPRFLLGYLPLAAWFCAHRLVVMEYHGRTQLFLETLPAPRWQVVWGKYLLGLLLLGTTAALICLSGIGLAVRQEPVGLQFSAYLLLRSLGFVLALWGFCFLMGFTGKFRTALYFGLMVGLMLLSFTTEFKFMEFAPMALVDPSSMPFDRLSMPWGAFWTSVGLSLVVTTAAVTIGLLNEGSLAERMSGRLTQKEKAVATFLIFLLIAGMGWFDVKRSKEPFRFEDEAVLKSSRLPLEILYLEGEALAPARRLLAFQEDRLERLKHNLGLEKLAPVRISLNESLDDLTVEHGQLSDAEGVLKRANFTRAGFDSANFTFHVVHALLEEATDGRATLETRHWLLDGYALWLAHDEEREAATLGRAVWVHRQNRVGLETLNGWSVFLDRQGDYQAASVGYSAVLALDEFYGREKVNQLGQKWLATRPHGDLRDLLAEWWHPGSRVFQEVTGESLERFAERWSERLDEWAEDAEIADQLTLYPEVVASAQVESAALRYRFELAQPNSQPLTCSLVHLKLPPFDTFVSPNDLIREEHLLKAGQTQAEFSLEGRYAPGQRVLVGLELDTPKLSQPVRLSTTRRVVP